MTIHRRIGTLLVLLVVALAAVASVRAMPPRASPTVVELPLGGPGAAAPDAGAADAAWELIEERWYVLMMQDQRAGYLHERGLRRADQTKLLSTMRLSIRRGEESLTIRMETETVETDEGRLVRMSSTSDMAGAPTTTTYEFRGERVQVETTANGRTTREIKPVPSGRWLSPLKAAAHVEARLREGARTITVRTIDAATGLRPIRSTRTVGERTNVEILGKTVPAVAWSTVVDLYPDVVNREYVDDDGQTVKTEIRLGALRIEVLLADRDLALSRLEPPELMAATLVRVDRPIRSARGTTEGEYVLSIDGSEPGGPGVVIDPPRTSAQRVERLEDGRVRVIVRTKEVESFDAAGCADAAFLGSSALIDHDHPAVRGLREDPAYAAMLAGAGADARARALAACRFVGRYISNKSLGVGFASASQVAQTREGDCTEHGVLLCALLRAEGIPARVVSGLVYIDEFLGQRHAFGYHMWTQAAIVDDETGRCVWLDLDAALGPGNAFDATHIALDADALAEDDSVNSMVRLAPLIGTLRIEVTRTSTR